MLPKDYILRARICQDKTNEYLYFIDRTHPIANKQGKVYLHRHIASIKLGRWILPTEDAHHRDENRTNNDPANLEVKSRSLHIREHRAKQKASSVPKVRIHRPRKRRFDIDASELRKLVWEEPVATVASRFGVSGVAIKKRCRLLGIETPPRGYWSKRSRDGT